MRINLHDDPAVLGIAMQTGLDEDSVVGKLLRIWGWAQGQTITGLVPNATAEWINRKVNHNGFAEAMSAQGWLCLRSGVIEIPKFERWLGKGAKSRLLDSRRKRLVRSLSGKCPDENRTTEEKSTEEIENTYSADKPPTAGGQSKKPKPPPKPRERDPLFDAIAEVTASDPKASGSHIGRVKKCLLQAEPPYTPEEVYKWAEMVRSEGWMTGIPTLGFLEKTIGRVRAKKIDPFKEMDGEAWKKRPWRP